MSRSKRVIRLAFGVTALLNLASCQETSGGRAARQESKVNSTHPEPAGYAVTAQFYDLMAEPTWKRRLGPALTDALAGFDPGSEPIIDVGAGTGLSTAAILQAVPDARVLAIEPDPAMRSALMTRLVSNNLLRRQVSIIPAGLFEAKLPPRISGAVAMSVIHHFEPGDRQRFWALLAEKLTPDGLAVIEVQLPKNERVPLTRFLRARVGDVDYEGWMQASPLPDDRQRWTMRYRAFRNGDVLDDQSTTYDMHVASFDQIADEMIDVGLQPHRVGDFLITRGRSRQREPEPRTLG